MTKEFKNTSFAELPNIFQKGNKTPVKKNPRRKMTEPFFVKKLYDHYGTWEKVGEKIGVSGTLLCFSIRTNKVALVNEIAARGVYESEIMPPTNEVDGKVFVSMLIDREALKALKPWLEQSGVSFKAF